MYFIEDDNSYAEIENSVRTYSINISLMYVEQ